MVLVLRKGASRQEIAALKEQLQRLPSRKKTDMKMDVRKYSGTIRLKDDPMAIQRKLRNEWE